MNGWWVRNFFIGQKASRKAVLEMVDPVAGAAASNDFYKVALVEYERFALGRSTRSCTQAVLHLDGDSLLDGDAWTQSPSKKVKKTHTNE